MKIDEGPPGDPSRRARDANAFFLIVVCLVVIAMIVGVFAIAMR